MYLISEFSNITKLTVKTLHYYDKEGILIPYKRDEHTGYRYYNEANYQQAQTISLLRKLDFSILEIKDVLSQSSKHDFSYFLKEKQQRIQKRMAADQLLLDMLKQEIKEQHSPTTNLKISPIEETDSLSQLTISQSFYGRYEDIGLVIGSLFKAAGPYVTGPVTTLLYDDNYQEQATMRVCLPVKQRFSLKQSGIEFWQLPQESVLKVMHHGGYDTLSTSYKRLLDYGKEHHYTLRFPSREVYLKGPGKTFWGNPHSYETQITIPFNRH